MRNLIKSIFNFFFGSGTKGKMKSPIRFKTNPKPNAKHRIKSEMIQSMDTLANPKIYIPQNRGINYYGKNFKVNRDRRITTLDLSSDLGRFENKLKTIWGSGLKITNAEIDAEKGKNRATRFKNQLEKKGIPSIKIEPYKDVIALLDNKDFNLKYEEALRNKCILIYNF